MTGHHLLKCWPEQFADVRAGRKTFEFRKDDRDFEVGDTLVLAEFDPAELQYSGASENRLVTHIMRTGFGLPNGYVVMSLAPAPASIVVGAEALVAAAESGWNACRRQVYLLSEDYTDRTYPLKDTNDTAGNFYRGQYDVAKSFAKAFNAFEARDCDYFKQIDFAALDASPSPQPNVVGDHDRGIDAALSAHYKAIEGGYQRTTKHMNEIVLAYLNAVRAALAAEGPQHDAVAAETELRIVRKELSALQQTLSQANVSVTKADITQWRKDWLEGNDPQDDTDCVTPFDRYLYEGGE